MIHDALRIIRKYHQLEPIDVTKLTGIARNQLSVLEKGNTKPGFITLERLAKCYGTRVSTLHMVSEMLDDLGYDGDLTATIQKPVYDLLRLS